MTLVDEFHKVQDGRMLSLPMRILHLCDSLNPAGLGGYESYLHYLSREMTLLGHESFIVTQSARKDSPDKEYKDSYEIWNIPGNNLEARKWEFLALPETERPSKANTMFTDNDLEENVTALGVQLLDIIQGLKPDIIHAHSTYIVFNRVLDLLRRSGELQHLPIVATIHGLPKPLILPGNIQTTDYEQLARFCPFDRILAVSDTVAAALQESLGEQKKEVYIQRLYIGINLEVFRPDASIEKQWDIAFLGRLEHMKGVDTFPEMLEILQVSRPDIRMVMTGEGSLRESLLAEIEQRGVKDLIRYLGVIPAQEVPQIINASRIFIYPSREEPFGLSVLEAMACEVPVITANIYGPSEVVTHEIDGILITPGSPTILADAIDRLLTDTEMYNSIRQNSRRKAEQFDIKYHVPKLLKIYELEKERKGGAPAPR